MSNRKFILVWLLFASALVVGWTELVDNFYGKNLDKTTFQAPATNGIPKYDGTKWVVGSDAGGPETLSISDLIDVGPMTEASGDILIFSGGVWTRLPKGIDGQVLKLATGLPSWATDSGGAETLASSDLTDFSTAKTGTGTSVVSNTGPTISTPTLVTPTITVTGTATTVLHGSAAGAASFSPVTPSDAAGSTSGSGNFVLATGASLTTPTLVTPTITVAGTSTTVLHGSAAGAASFSAVTASDADTTITNRLNPTPGAAGRIPVDAGAGTPYTFVAAGTSSQVLVGGASPAFGTVTTAMASTATAVSVGATNATGSSSSFARADHTHAVTDLSITSQATEDLLRFNGTNWVRLAKGSNSTVLNTSSGGVVGYSTVTNAMLAGSITGDKVSTLPNTYSPVSDSDVTIQGGATNRNVILDPTGSGRAQVSDTFGTWAMGGLLFANTSDVGTVLNTTALTSFGTIYSIPDNAPAAGRVIHIVGGGEVTAGADVNQALKLDVQFGGVTVADFGTDMQIAISTTATSIGFSFDVWVIVRAGGDAGSVMSHGILQVGRQGSIAQDRGNWKCVPVTGATAIDFNGAATPITVRSAFGTNTAGTESITLRNVAITVN